MPRFGWTSLAYLLFVLIVLAALVRLDGGAAETRSLAAQAPRGAAKTVATSGSAAPAADAPAKAQDTTRMTWRIESAASSLVDLRGDGGVQRARSLRPRAPSPPSSNTAPPLFYRPSPEGALPGGAGPVCGDLRGVARSSRVVFPLQRRYFYSYEDTWGAPRPQGGHEGTDLMAPAGTPEYAVTDGTVVPVAGSSANGWNGLGGYAVMVRADYSIGPIERGDLFYYAHLERPSPLKVGARVRAGQVVGYTGDTGQGPEVTRGLFPPHLHLGWYDAAGTRSNVASGAMNPYPLLEWIKANGGAVTGGSSARYCEAPSPSTAENRWPAPDNPGVRPDLDTGSKDPEPSPVVEETRARTTPAQRAQGPERPARVPQDRASPEETREAREAPEKARETGRPARPEASKPPNRDPEASRPATSDPPRREHSRREPPEPPTSGDASPTRPSPGPPTQGDPSVPPAGPHPGDPQQGSTSDPAKRDPDDPEKRDRPDKHRREEKRQEREQDEERAEQEREEEKDEPGTSPEPFTEQPPPEDPSPPDPETDEDRAEEPEATEPVPETTISETTISETTISETTMASEATVRDVSGG